MGGRDGATESCIVEQIHVHRCYSWESTGMTLDLYTLKKSVIDYYFVTVAAVT